MCQLVLELLYSTQPTKNVWCYSILSQHSIDWNFQVCCPIPNTCTHKLLALWPRLCATVNPNNKSTVFWLVMPIPYSLILWWRIIWIALTWHASPQDIGQHLSVSERTVRRHLKMFEDVKPCSRRSGPLCLFRKYKQLMLVRLILENPGIYLHEIQQQLFQCFYNL